MQQQPERQLTLHKTTKVPEKDVPVVTKVQPVTEAATYQFDIDGFELSPTDEPSSTPTEFLSSLRDPSTSTPTPGVTRPPSNQPIVPTTAHPTNSPTYSSTNSPTSPPTESTESPTKVPSAEETPNAPPESPSTRVPTAGARTEVPTGAPSAPPTDSPTTSSPSENPTETPSQADSRIMEEVAQAVENNVVSHPTSTPTTLIFQGEGEFLPEDETENFSQTEPDGTEGDSQGEQQQPLPGMDEEAIAGNMDPTDADQFVPVPDYYYTELRPFSVFVQADQDLSTDLGIPLYLLLEMGETLTTLVDIKITNLTIQMGVVEMPEGSVRHARRAQHANHYHWNQLFFQGIAQFDDSTVYPPVTVQNIQALVLSDEASLQEFWDDEGYGETYDKLVLENTTLLPLPTPAPVTEPPAQEPQQAPTPPPQESQTAASTTEPDEDSKRGSNIWIMIPMVIVFFMVCFCIICLAGRLQYLSARAQDKYNEKYGLDYNIYDKDISKDIFREEYLMSEHTENEQDFPHGQSRIIVEGVRSVDFLNHLIKTESENSRQNSTKSPAQEEAAAEDEEEEIQGGFTDGEVRKVFPAEEAPNAYYGRGGPMASAVNDTRLSGSGSESNNGSFSGRLPGKNRKVVVDVGVILPGGNGGDDDSSAESVPPDEDIAPMPKTPSEAASDDAYHVLPTLIHVGGNVLTDTSDRDPSARSLSSRDSGTFAPKDKSGMGNSSGRERSSRFSRKTPGSFPSSGEDKGAMGNSSRGSRGDRISRFNRKGSDDSNHMGSSSRGDRSTRSTRSVRSTNSGSSMGSFYSCQGDLV